MSRSLAVVILTSSLLAGAVPEARAQLNVTALPAPCTSATPNNASNDDAVAFNCAIGLLPADGGEIYIPAGTYNLNATVSVPGAWSERSVAFRGEGQGITRLVWHHNGDGLSFVSTSATVNKTLSVRSLSLIKMSPNGAVPAIGGAAIKGQWPLPPSGHASFGVVTTTIEDVHIGTSPWPSAIAYWHFGIQLVNETAAKISLFTIQGPGSDGGISGIQIGGGNVAPLGATSSISTRIRNGAIMKFVRGIEQIEHSEGLHVQDVLMRDVGYGIQLTDTLGTTLANNEIRARVCGIELTRVDRVNVTNNLIYDLGLENFIGIALLGTPPPLGDQTPIINQLNHLIGNSIHSDSDSHTRKGIVLDPAGGQVGNTLVHGNNTSNMTKGIVLVASVSNSMVVGNVNTVAAGGTKIDGTGTNTTFDTNK